MPAGGPRVGTAKKRVGPPCNFGASGSEPSTAIAADHGAYGVVGAKVLGAVDIEQCGEF
jgi:hypothetical protein